MDIKDQKISGISGNSSSFSFSSSSREAGSPLNVSWNKLSNLTPLDSIHLVDSGIQKILQGNTETGSNANLVAAFEKNLLWHDVQVTEGGTVTQGIAEGNTGQANPAQSVSSLPSSIYHPNYNVDMPHHATAVGSSGRYDSFSNLDLAKFDHADSDNVSVFYETAADGEFAEAADLPKEIPPLGYFPFDNIGFNALTVDHVDHPAGRLTVFSEPVEIVITPVPELLPPVADPNDYSFSADTFNEGGTSESLLFSSLALQGSQIFHFTLGNILTDPQNLSLPVSGTNPVDSDPEGTALLINSTSDPTLTIVGVDIDLTLVTGPLPVGEVTEYQFTYQGNVGVLIVSQDGTLSLETAAPNLFGPLTPAQTAIFGFDYTNRDGDGLTSNVAHVNINILGINDPPTAIDDFNQVQEVIPDSGGRGEGESSLLLASSSLTLNGADPRTIATGNILANDTDPDGSFAAGDFSVVSVAGHVFNNMNATWTLTISDEAGGDVGSMSGWQLTLQTQTTTYVFTNPAVLTILDNTTVSSDIAVSGIVGPITHASLTLFGFEHTFFGDLVGSLEASNGQSVELFNRINGGNKVNGDVTLDDSASSNIVGATEPISGTFQTSSGSALNDFVNSFPTTLVIHGQYGDFTIQQDGSYTYQLDTVNPDVLALPLGQSLEDIVPYTMQDSDGLTSSAVLHIDILGNNLPPVAEPNTYTAGAGEVDAVVSSGFFVGNIITNADLVNGVDTDPENTLLTVNSVFNPTLTIAGSGVTLTPVSVSGELAAYQFTFQGNTGTFEIDPNGDVILVGSSENLFVDLAVGENVIFSFDYTNKDTGNLISNTAHVDLTINGENDPPLAQPNTYTAGAGEVDAVVSGGFFVGNIITNADPVRGVDTDPENDLLTVNSVLNPILTIAGNGITLTPISVSGELAAYQFTFQGNTGTFEINPNGDVILVGSSGNLFLGLGAGEKAVFSFDYTDQDTAGLISNTAHVDLTINGENDTPTAQPNTYTAGAGDVDTAIAGGGFLVGNIITDAHPINGIDSDPDNDVLLVNSVFNPTLTITGSGVTLTPVSVSGELAAYQFTFQGNTGTFEIDPNGDVTLVGSSGNLFIDLVAGENVIFSFDYTDQDTAGLISNTAHVDLTINGENDPPLAQPNTYETDAETVAPLVSGGYFVGNIKDDAGPLKDSDPEGDAFNIHAVSGASLAIAGSNFALTPVSISGDVAAYNFQYNGNTGTFEIRSNGDVTLTAVVGSFFLENLAVGKDLVFSFDYTDQDTGGAISNPAHVDFTIQGSNEPAVAYPNTYMIGAINADAAIASGGLLVGNIITNVDLINNADADPESGLLIVNSVLNPTLTIAGNDVTLTPVSVPGDAAAYQFDFQGNTGALEIDQNGTVILTGSSGNLFADLNPGENATFSFDYTNQDLAGSSSNSAHVTFTVQGENNPPVTNNSVLNLDDNQSYTLTLSNFPFSDPNPSDTFQNLIINNLPGEGALLLNGAPVTAGQSISAIDINNGELTYVPLLSSTTDQNFQFSVSDGTASSNPVTLSIHVDGPSVLDISIPAINPTNLPVPSSIATNGNDALLGTNGNDAIDGLAGNDVIYGFQGNDNLFVGYSQVVTNGDFEQGTIFDPTSNLTRFGWTGTEGLEIGSSLGYGLSGVSPNVGHGNLITELGVSVDSTMFQSITGWG